MTISRDSFNCPVEATIKLIGGKYKAVILFHLSSATLRYSEISRLVPQATSKMLTQQLREMEENGLIERVVHPIIPPKVEYSLTEFGKTFIPVLDAMCQWGDQYLNNSIESAPIK